MGPKFWAHLGLGAWISNFVMHAIPFLQFAALLISIAAAVRAWRKKS